MEAPANASVTCAEAECKAEVTVFRFRKNNGWRCEKCAPAREVCNKCSNHTDIPNKCWKHKKYFCKDGTWCYMYMEGLLSQTLFQHYDSQHQDIRIEAGSSWRMAESEEWRHVTTAAGTAMCKYFLKDFCFYLYVYTNLQSEQLREFRCEVQVTNPTTGYAHTYTPDAEYDEYYDRRVIDVKQEFDVIVNIIKIE